MQDLICPFSAALARNTFSCTNAAEIVRRGGVEFACGSGSAHSDCSHLLQRLKVAALPAFGVADDLLEMPHSVLQKIQLGGLTGLQQLVTGAAKAADNGDIAVLVAGARAQFSTLDAIPCERVVAHITGYRLPRRRDR